MEDIIIIKAGLKAQIYFRHTCSQCLAILEVKDSVQDFKCPCCENEEKCLQSPETMTKKYNVEQPKESPRKNVSKKPSFMGKLV
jgi:predicted RNA-binding Zn-ribbon protein involved in translation (DUF1610 family)